MRTVILSGELGQRFGRSWSLDVATPAEALRAIEANRPGFFRHLIDSAEDGVGYRVLLERRALAPEELSGPFGGEKLRLVPVVGGAGDGRNVGKIVVGALLVAAAVYFSGGSMAATIPYGMGMSYGSLAMFGVALALGGVSGLLAKPTDLGDTNPADRKPSYVFNGPVNTISQGGCVPVGFGRLIVGSTPISGGITVDETALD